MPVADQIFLLGSGFTKAAIPAAPLNSDLVTAVTLRAGTRSVLAKYRDMYGTSDIELLLTRLDLECLRDSTKLSDRREIEGELASYFKLFRFKPNQFEDRTWLKTFATQAIPNGSAIINLNYDCFLDGLLDSMAIWSPNGGYASVDDIFAEAPKNAREIVIYKIHGSEHFRVSKINDRPEQDAIAFEFNEEIFPRSGAGCRFGGGIDSRPYLIAPSFVKTPHRQIAQGMLKLLDLAATARTFVAIGCGFRREDSYLWLLLTRFLSRRQMKRLVIVDPNAGELRDRIYSYWVGDIEKWMKLQLLTSGLEKSIDELCAIAEVPN